MFELTNPVDADDLTRFSNALNSALGGLSITNVTHDAIAKVAREVGLPAEFVRIVDEAFATARSSDTPAVTSSGAQHMLDQPEFQDLRTLRAIYASSRSREALRPRRRLDARRRYDGQDRPRDRLDNVTECSVVTVPYRIGEGVGVLAILGPRRMPYGRLMALASGTAASLSAHLSSPPNR